MNDYEKLKEIIDEIDDLIEQAVRSACLLPTILDELRLMQMICLVQDKMLYLKQATLWVS